MNCEKLIWSLDEHGVRCAEHLGVRYTIKVVRAVGGDYYHELSAAGMIDVCGTRAFCEDMAQKWAAAGFARRQKESADAAKKPDIPDIPDSVPQYRQRDFAAAKAVQEHDLAALFDAEAERDLLLKAVATLTRKVERTQKLLDAIRRGHRFQTVQAQGELSEIRIQFLLDNTGGYFGREELQAMPEAEFAELYDGIHNCLEFGHSTADYCHNSDLTRYGRRQSL